MQTFDLNFAANAGSRFGDGEFQHAILIVGSDMTVVCIFRQGKAVLKYTGNPLNTMILIFFLLVFTVAFAGNGEYVAFHGHINMVCINTG